MKKSCKLNTGFRVAIILRGRIAYQPLKEEYQGFIDGTLVTLLMVVRRGELEMVVGRKKVRNKALEGLIYALDIVDRPGKKARPKSDWDIGLDC